jgi:hypothetical protein
MKNQRHPLTIAVVCLLAGAAIYFSTRSENILLNQWLAHIADGKGLQFFQGLISNVWVPDWILYSLPDALWMMALTLFILMIWDFKIHRRSLAWLTLAVVAGTGLEVLQGLHWMRGTFDVVDLLLIFLAASIPIMITLLKQRLCASI